MPSHQQVNVSGIDVDEGLATLLEYLWEAGIATQFSCQGGPSQAMIVFPTVTDALRFVQETLAVTGDYACYSDRLPIRVTAPMPGYVAARAIVRWPARCTPIWEAAWNGTPLPLDDALEIFHPGHKAECDRLDAEEEASHA